MGQITIITVMEMIGTVAFSISGALIAVRCCLDLFGVVLVGCITSVGGGIMRDVLLGKFPPTVFSNWIPLAVAASTATIVFIVSWFHAEKFETFEKRIENANNFFDAIGLATFSVTGTEIACEAGFSDMAVFSIAMGLITGIGGGIVRDILVDKTPYVLQKHVYALAAIIGSALYYCIRICGYQFIAVAVGIAAIILIRLLATKFHWKLPKVNWNNKNP